MHNVAAGVTHVATSRTSNAFVIEGDSGLILVDVGTAKGAAVMLKTITDMGHKLTDVTTIVITHAHPDHVQGIPEVRKHTGARVLVHRDDAAWLPGGRVPADGRSGFLARRLDGLKVGQWTPFEADDIVEDGDVIAGSGGLRVVHTPGHSPGHIALLHEPTRTALVGDAVFNNGRFGLGPATFAADTTARAAGVARIPADLRAVGFGHGNPLAGAEVDGFLAFLETLRRTH